jgi:hypothetical protein
VPGLLNRTSIILFGLFSVVAINACENLIIRPLLADLRPATARMSVADMLKQQANAMSIRTLTTLGLIFLAAALVYCYLSFNEAPWWREFELLFAGLFGWFAIIFFGMLFAKLRK